MAIALLSLAGCAPDAGTTIEVVFDPCNARVVPAADAAPHEVEAIDAALRLWNEAAGLDLGREGDAPPIEVRFVASVPALFGVYDDGVGVIMINRAIQDAGARSIVIAHELGHAFGLVHVPPSVEASLMNPGNTSVAPTIGDVERLGDLWSACQSSNSMD